MRSAPALKRVDDELKDRDADLEAANAELERFASVASRDLQEPLRKIIAFSELLQTELWDDLGELAQHYLGGARAAPLG